MIQLPGQQLIIYNDSDDKIKDLCFYMPGTDIVYKTKKIAAHMHNEEHIYDGYAGDLIFFFSSNPEATFIFPSLITGKDMNNTTSYFLVFHIHKDEHDAYQITWDSSYKENERSLYTI